MTRGARLFGASSRWDLALGSLIALVALPGCPMTDDYFVVDHGGTTGMETGGVGGAGFAGTGGKIPKGDSGGSGGFSATGGVTGTGGGLPDSWGKTSPPPDAFSPRERAAYTSIGSQLFVWGGVNESGTALNSGALYDPRNDSWRDVKNDASTPTPRSSASAVWTGSVVVVWGGLDPLTMEPLGDGAIYDPVMDAWSPMSPGPRARAAPFGASSDQRVVFFGGQDAAGPIGGLDVYDPRTNTWQPGMTNSPPAAADPAAAGGALTFWAYGGRTSTNTGVADSNYWSMTTNRWLPSEALAPGRWGSFAAFADGTFFVWGGRDINGPFRDGSGYRIIELDWNAMGQTLAPSARFAVDRESGWTFAVDPDGLRPIVVMIAGFDAPGSYLKDGGIYDAKRGEWTAIPAWPGPPTHAFGAVGIAAGQLVVWGGRDGDRPTNQGVRYTLPN